LLRESVPVAVPFVLTEGTALLASGDDTVVVDLTGVTFMDVRGVGGLTTLRKRATARGVDLVLRNTPPTVDRVLEATRLTGHFLRETAV
jgi:anti-anti-sigma factor